MAKAAKLEVVPDEETGTDIVAIVAQTPVVVLVDSKQRASLYAHIEREIEAFVPDLTSKKGRDAIAALAFKVTRTKTAIDAAGKTLNEEARAKINVVDEARRDARNTLDILAERARKPLTEWENAEKERVEECREIITDFKHDGQITIDDTAETVRARGAHVWSIALDADRFGDMLAEAQEAKDAAVTALKSALTRLTKEEADRAELEKLRAAEAERVRVEEERAAAAEIERAQAEAARIAEEQAKAAAEADANRIKDAEEAAAQAARDEANRVAEAAESKRRYASAIIAHIQEVGLGMIGGQPQPYGVLLHELTNKVEIDDSLGDMQDAVRSIRDATLKGLEAAMERSNERAKREEEQEAQRKAEQEAAALAENKAHRTRVKTAAKQAIMTCGASEETAQKIVLAIIAGEVPAVKLAFS